MHASGDNKQLMQNDIAINIAAAAKQRKIDKLRTDDKHEQDQ